MFSFLKSCRKKFVTVNLDRIIYLLEYRWFNKLKTGLTLDWEVGCEGGWGSRVWEMWLWCKEDWINLLSLQCAFIPNGSDMSRAQQYLPSHCTGRGRTHGKCEGEQESRREQHMRNKDSLQSVRETFKPLPSKPETRKTIISPTCCHGVSNYLWPAVHQRDYGKKNR